MSTSYGAAEAEAAKHHTSTHAIATERFIGLS